MARIIIHPGEHLADELKALSMSANELAKELGVPTNRITEITAAGGAGNRRGPGKNSSASRGRQDEQRSEYGAFNTSKLRFGGRRRRSLARVLPFFQNR